MAVPATPSPLTIGPRTFVWGERTYLMGVLNVSPDSFSGDGLGEVEAAVAQARRLVAEGGGPGGGGAAVAQARRWVAEGADLVAVGGQSTRPGFAELAPEEEIRRVVPVIERLGVGGGGGGTVETTTSGG